MPAKQILTVAQIAVSTWRVKAMLSPVQKDKEYKVIKKRINEITNRKTFNEVLDNCMLNDDEKALLRMKYIERRDLTYIADMLHVSYATVKRWHKHAITVFSKELQNNN